MPVPPTFGVLATGSTVSSTWDPAAKGANITLSGGNLIATSAAGGSYRQGRGTSSKTGGRWHFEVTVSGAVSIEGPGVGICNSSSSLNDAVGLDNNGIAWYVGGQVFIGGVQIDTIDPFIVGSVLAVELDMVSQSVFFQKLGGIRTSGFSIAVIAGAIFPTFVQYANGGVGTANFGATAFSIAPTAGFSAWG